MAHSWQMGLTAGRYGSQVAVVANSWEMWLIAGRCGSQLEEVAHSWQMGLTAGRYGSQLGDVAHSWEMWFTVATTRQCFCDMLQYNKKMFCSQETKWSFDTIFRENQTEEICLALINDVRQSQQLSSVPILEVLFQAGDILVHNKKSNLKLQSQENLTPVY